jgi:SWI/SNF-related matrix-associated actin-dependent regulator of chromatin subfamily A-like protein 1
MSAHPLYEAVIALALRCDGAADKDGQGFNGTDAKYGKQLAATPFEAWGNEAQVQAYEMLAKYAKQLALVGISYADIPRPEGPKPAKRINALRAIDLRNGKIVVTLPYGDTANPKGPLGAYWNRDERAWVVSPSRYGKVQTWAEQHNIAISTRALELLDKAPKQALDAYNGSVTLDHESLAIKFDYNPQIVEAVRTIPGRRFDKESSTWYAPKESVSIVRAFANDNKFFVSDEVKALPDVKLFVGPKILVHGKSFAISFQYDAELISQVREMPGSEWSAELRLWLVPIECIEEVLTFYQQHNAKLSPEARELINEAASVHDVIAASQAKDAEISIEGFGGAGYQLMPFQRAGVAYGMRALGYEYQEGKWNRTSLPTGGGVLIGDEMGLGKTVQGLAILKATEAFPAVIVCPASLKLNWQRETEKWIKGIKVKVLSGTSGNLPDADIYIVNYDILTHWVDKFGVLNGIILDESHYIKNGSAQRSKAAIRLADKVPIQGTRVCLSGTPVVNMPLELMTQLRVIARLDDFGGASKFRGEFGRSSSRALAMLNRKLRATCYVRRRKTDVLTELPPKMWSELLVEGDPAVMKEYKKAEADIIKYLTDLALKLAIEAGADSEEAKREAWQRALRARAAEHLVAISTLKQLAAKAKMKAAKEWIGDFVETDKKLVTFGWHTEVVNMVAENFANGCKIQGGVSIERRQQAVDAFQNSDEQKVIACQIKAAGVGLTLTAASDVLFIEQGWTPADMDQAVDRCHRIGQKDSVTGWLMLTKDTIDEDIAALIQAKRVVVNQATDGVLTNDENEGSMVGDLLVGLVERGLNK